MITVELIPDLDILRDINMSPAKFEELLNG
jgi:hypothetical protein